MSNPLQPDDPRHERAIEAVVGKTWSHSRTVNEILDTYFASLEEQGVVLVEAYAGDDAGRA